MKKNSGRKTKEQVTKIDDAEKNLQLEADNEQSAIESTASLSQESKTDKEVSEEVAPADHKAVVTAVPATDDDSTKLPESESESEPKAERKEAPSESAPAATTAASEPEPVLESKTAPQAAPEVVAPIPSKSNNATGIIAIILVLLLAAGGYYFYLQLSNKLIANSDGVAELEKNQVSEHDKTRSQLSDKLSNAQNSVQKLSTQVAASNKTVLLLQDKLLDLSGRRPNDWLLAEANYLVRLAGRKLWLEKDQQTASSLLSTADLRIAEMNDPSLLSLRKALAKDIAAIQALPKDQTESTALRIDGLISQVDNLKLNTITLPESVTEDDGQLSVSPADWKVNIGKTWDSFVEGFITVRRINGSVEPLMSPKQQWYLEENLKGKLIQSQLALYRHQQDAFEHAIELATRWVMQFYDRGDSTTEFMLKEFAELKQLNITVEYPTKFDSSDLLYVELSRRSIITSANQGG